MDNREALKIGDHFNLTNLIKNGNDVFDNCNRFNTCVLTNILPNGEWQFKKYWCQYSRDEYPFLSSTTTWDVYSDYATQHFLIEKINDPETEGFKECKLKYYLQRKLDEIKSEKGKLEAAKKTYNSLINEKYIGGNVLPKHISIECKYMGSVFSNSECEIILRNIVYLQKAKSPNKWISFTWEDYKAFCYHNVSDSELGVINAFVSGGKPVWNTSTVIGGGWLLKDGENYSFALQMIEMLISNYPVS